MRCSQPSKVPGEKLGQRAEDPDERLLGEVLGVLARCPTGGRPAGTRARSGRARPAPTSAPPRPRPRAARRSRTRPQDRRPDRRKPPRTRRERRTRLASGARHDQRTGAVPVFPRAPGSQEMHRRTTARRRPWPAGGRAARQLPSPGDERPAAAGRRHRRGRRLRRPVRRRDARDGGRPGARGRSLTGTAAGRARRRRDAGGPGLDAWAPGRSSSIGSGGGLAGLWLMQGMRRDGVLTALDGDPEQLRAARKAFTEAGIAAGRTRMIFGTPAEVLPRLSPGAYDMVVCAGPPREYSEHLPGLLDLVRVGGMLVCHGLLEGDRVADRTVARPADGRLAGDQPRRSRTTRRCCPPSSRSATDSWSPPSGS